MKFFSVAMCGDKFTVIFLFVLSHTISFATMAQISLSLIHLMIIRSKSVKLKQMVNSLLLWISVTSYTPYFYQHFTV